MATVTSAPSTASYPGNEWEMPPVAARVSWAAILAGAVVAMATYFVLTLLGGAIGLTVSDDVTAETMLTGASIWAVAANVIALFVGGCVTSRCMEGENRMQAIIHSIIQWGVVVAMMLWLVSSGLRAGYGAFWAASAFPETSLRADDWETAARRGGVPQATIDSWRDQAQSVDSEEARRAAATYATHAAWYLLLGTLLSLAAAIGGGLCGAGPDPSRRQRVEVGRNGSV